MLESKEVNQFIKKSWALSVAKLSAVELL